MLWPYLPTPGIPRTRDLAWAVGSCTISTPDLHRCPSTSRWLGCATPSTLTPRELLVLPADTREWLLAYAVPLQRAYDTLSTPLGHGLIHADVQPDNLLQESRRAVAAHCGDQPDLVPARRPAAAHA